MKTTLLIMAAGIGSRFGTVASSVALSLHFAKVSDTTQLPNNSDEFDNSSNGL
ncbi:MAG: hypothetical protein PHT76_04420 [Anaerostipes sp.]|nr:hypothetical protein [Anaerostipes sp.]